MFCKCLELSWFWKKEYVFPANKTTDTPEIFKQNKYKSSIMEYSTTGNFIFWRQEKAKNAIGKKYIFLKLIVYNFYDKNIFFQNS